MRPMVIFKAFGTYRVTSATNYYATIRDANQVQELRDFNSADEIIAYYCEHFGYKAEDFIIIKED